MLYHPISLRGICIGSLMKNTVGGRESVKGMGKVLMSIITTESRNRNTKLIFNFIIKGLKIWKITQNDFLLWSTMYIENNH